MEKRKSSFIDSRDITGRAMKVAESQVSASGLKQRFHRQHEPTNCEKHIKDTIEQVKKLNELFSEIQTLSENSSLYPHFAEYCDKFVKSLTKLTNQFESYMRTGSKHFEKEAFSKYTSFFYHM